MITEREREIPDMGVGEILLSNSEGSIQRLFGLKIKERKKKYWRIIGLVEIVTSFVIIKTGLENEEQKNKSTSKKGDWERISFSIEVSISIAIFIEVIKAKLCW